MRETGVLGPAVRRPLRLAAGPSDVTGPPFRPAMAGSVNSLARVLM